MADPEKVSTLLEFGVGHEDAVAALIKSENDLERAIALIFEEPRVTKHESDQDMQEAIAQSLSMDGLNRSEFTGFEVSSADAKKNDGEPFAMEELREWPVLSYLLLVLAEVDGFSEVLSEANHASVWSATSTLCEQESFADLVSQSLREQQESTKKFGSVAAIGNYLVSKTNIAFPCSVSQTMDTIRSILMRESSDEKAAKIKRILSIPILRESISSTVDYISALELSAFYHDQDLRIWLAKSLSAPKTFLFPTDTSQKFMILSFPQMAHIRVPLELYIDRHLKKNAFIMGPKDRELQQKESELEKIESKRQEYANSSIILEAIKFLEKYPQFASPNLSSGLLEYHSTQMSKQNDLDEKSSVIRRRMSDIFEVPALLKEGLKLFGILKPSSLYLLKSNIWWKFSDKNVEKMNSDFLDSDLEDISCIFYKS